MSSRSTIAQGEVGGVQTVGIRSAIATGRVATYSALAASVAALPLPWLPDSFLLRIRGALVHDVAAVHGLSLTPEAREALAQPSPDGQRSFGSQALRYLGVRFAIRALTRFGPIALVWPLREALRTYALGHLFGRYLEVGRVERAVRIDIGEAQRVRRAVDGAILRAITVQSPPADQPTRVDDQRDAATALVDTLLGFAAGVPGRLIHRLDAAFDALLLQSAPPAGANEGGRRTTNPDHG
jgi:hypothetical protein